MSLITDNIMYLYLKIHEDPSIEPSYIESMSILELKLGASYFQEKKELYCCKKEIQEYKDERNNGQQNTDILEGITNVRKKSVKGKDEMKW